MNHAEDASNFSLTNGIHSDTTPELVLNGDEKPLINGQHVNGHPTSNPSPAADSPDTPVSIIAAPDVKIEIDFQEQESDVRHEPIPTKLIDAVDRSDTASTIPQPGTPADPCMFPFCRIFQSLLIRLPATIPFHVPTGTPPPPPGELLEDVKLAEATSLPSSNEDILMGDAATETPATTPGLLPDSSMATIELNGASTSYSSPNERDDDHNPPPAKRARMHSDADIASLAHVSLVSSCTPMQAC